MSSIVTTVFKATIGLLVNKGRDKAAEKLKGGDVTDQKFRGFIVRELDDIKSKLDGLSRQNLLTSISYFRHGVMYLFKLLDDARSVKDGNTVTTQAAAGTEDKTLTVTLQSSSAAVNTLSLSKGLQNVNLSDFNDSDKRALSDAKKEFEVACLEATKAFNNEALSTSDRIKAMVIRVAATTLQRVDYPGDAIDACTLCLGDLHSMSAIQNSFKVELEKGFMAQLNKVERRQIISSVCHLNRVIYDVMQIVGKDVYLWDWPAVDIGEDKVDPLRDARLTEVLRKQGMEHCYVPWSFGQEGEEEHKLKYPQGIATNSKGQFIIADDGDSNVKVFDSSGKFMNHFSLPTYDIETNILDVATDMNDNIYVLARLRKPGAEGYDGVVYVFNDTADLHHKFPLRRGGWYRLAIGDNGKVLVLAPLGGNNGVDVYETDGQFVRSFEDGILKTTCDITATNDGRVMVVDREDYCIHIFSEHGDHLNTFKLKGSYVYPRIAFHRAREHVVVAGKEQEVDHVHVEIFTKDGKFVRSIQKTKDILWLTGITVTTDGRIAVLSNHEMVLIV